MKQANPQSPVPNPQSPIRIPQSPVPSPEIANCCNTSPRVARRRRGAYATSILLASLVTTALVAQRPAQAGWYAVALPDDSLPPPIPREFRGEWIATVGNLDWPSRPGLPASEQQAELLAILDRAVQMHLNAIVFQVRPAADALYKSSLEPWSAVLTGTMGKDPGWDPLAFAVAESHKRGLELHAWFNPYRARYRDDKAKATRTHVSRAMASVVKRYGPYLWMDPGEPRVRDLTTKVIVDVVKRYDVDGVHVDDYFYPYPERDRRARVIDFPDGVSWKKYRKSGGTLERDDWRRRNVDLLVQNLYTEIKKAKPWVRFGVSPFGIWRPGYPASVRGFDQYANLYADPRKWLAEGWLDYLTPQLYWRSGAPEQNYAALLGWWASQNVRGRHLWPGNAAYKVTNGGERWSAAELVNQIRLTRDQPGAGGNVHFDESALRANYDDVRGRMAAGPYLAPALPPATPWLSRGVAPAPVVTRQNAPDGIVLQVTVPAAPAGARAGAAAARSSSVPRWWLVRARYPDGWHALIVDAAERTVRLPPDGGGQLADMVAMNAVDRVGVESAPVFLLPPQSAVGGRGSRVPK
jgi:uncharacterized lipoprotein YddW (UPF0748 family)